MSIRVRKRATQKAIIDAQTANQELLLQSIEQLPAQTIKNVETIASQQDRQYFRSSSISLLSNRLIAMPKKSQKQAIVEAQDALIEAIEHLPEQVIKNVETINNHQDRHHQNTTTHQRVLDRIASTFGRPQFLYFQIAFFTVWIICSNLAERDLLTKNFPLFDLRHHGLEIASLLISTEVLIYQTRQEKLGKEQSHLILQLNLLTEQKIAKVISLVEELRTDLPNVKNRNDLEAEAMKQAIDPQAILEVLQHSPITPVESENR